jgi:RHS repeat-associated protein
MPPIVGVIEKKYAAGQRSFALVYDKRGNLVQKGSRSFRYDAENHLIRVSDRGRETIVENVFDALGQLVIQKTRGETLVFIDGIYEESGTHASRHVRAGALLVSTIVTPIESVRLIAEAPPSPYGLDRSGNTHPEWVAAALACFALVAFVATPCGARRRSLILLGHSVAGVKERPSKALFLMLFIPVFAFVNSQPAYGGSTPAREPESTQPETRYYYHANHLGSINVVTDDRGTAVARHEYGPYGEPADLTGPSGASLRIGFNGRRYEEATDLYYFGARYYDPEIGRFLTADTQVPDPMNPKMLHRYAFAGDNPVRYVDPTGHAFWEWFLAGFVIGALIVIGIATCGVGLAIGITVLGGALLFVMGAAALGAAAFGIYSAVRMAGVGICLTPYTIGFGVDALASAGSFFATLAADIFVGAVLGGLGTVAQFLAEGKGPEAMLVGALGEEVLTSAIKGAILGVVFGGVLRGVSAALKAYKAVDKICDALGVVLGLEDLSEVGLSGANVDFSFSDMFGNDANWFGNSPPKPLGIPSWVFAGTSLGYRQGNAMGSLFNTMPLTP